MDDVIIYIGYKTVFGAISIEVLLFWLRFVLFNFFLYDSFLMYLGWVMSNLLSREKVSFHSIGLEFITRRPLLFWNIRFYYRFYCGSFIVDFGFNLFFLNGFSWGINTEIC